MKKLTFEQKIILHMALNNFIESTESAKENSYIPLKRLESDIAIAKDLQDSINLLVIS